MAAHLHHLRRYSSDMGSGWEVWVEVDGMGQLEPGYAAYEQRRDGLWFTRGGSPEAPKEEERLGDPPTELAAWETAVRHAKRRWGRVESRWSRPQERGIRPPSTALYLGQVAERLGLKRTTVEAYRSRGQMPAADGQDVHGHPWWLPLTLAAWRGEFAEDVTR